MLTLTSPNNCVTTNCYYWQTSTCASGASASSGAANMVYRTTNPLSQADSGGIVAIFPYLAGGAHGVTTTKAGVATDTYDANGDLTSVTYSSPASGYAATANVAYRHHRRLAGHHDGRHRHDQLYLRRRWRPAVDRVRAGHRFDSDSVNAVYTCTYFTNGNRSSVIYPPTTRGHHSYTRRKL